jgi:hypothetical protein
MDKSLVFLLLNRYIEIGKKYRINVIDSDWHFQAKS